MHTLDHPIARFEQRFEAARQAEPCDVTAMSLATSDPDGHPSVRVVLLKNVTPEGGFDFYTNLRSRKSQQLMANPHAALCFLWMTLGEQVRIEGSVKRLLSGDEDAYFATRDKGSQLGAWASKQSQPLSDRDELEQRLTAVRQRFLEGPVPRPDFWGGYRLMAQRIEFWSAGQDRLHHRELYVRAGLGWQKSLLYP